MDCEFYDGQRGHVVKIPSFLMKIKPSDQKSRHKLPY